MKNKLIFNRIQALSLGAATVAVFAAGWMLGLTGINYKPLTWTLLVIAAAGLISTVAAGWNTSSPRVTPLGQSVLFGFGFAAMSATCLYAGIKWHGAEETLGGVVFAIAGVASIVWTCRTGRSG